MALEQLHEREAELSERTQSARRAYASLIEELEAIAWYDQRSDAAGDEELRDILLHNRNEEMEHACMMLEWLRRNVAGWDENLKTYLFAEGRITEQEERETDESDAASSGLEIGKL